MSSFRPKLAVFKLTSCDGCQVALLNLEDELLELANAIDIAYFPEATDTASDFPYDLTLVEGAISTPCEREHIQKIRADSKFLVAMGACATAGGIQALRNGASLEEFVRAVYPGGAQLECLRDCTPVSAHVKVDFEIPGCPINSQQLLEVITALLHGRQPHLPGHAVCVDCKRRGISCVLVARGAPCLGPLTRTGCGAICPGMSRGCYGCFGPMEYANPDSLLAQFRSQDLPEDAVLRLLRGFTAYADVFRTAGDRVREKQP